ncbi:hypothetical protein HK100_011020, partial [Physocladia obscura]
QLTEDNLKAHTKLSKNQPWSFVERISSWRMSLPEKFEEPGNEIPDSPIRKSDSANKIQSFTTLSGMQNHYRTIQQRPTTTTAAITVANKMSSHNTSMSNGHLVPAQVQFTETATFESSRGKLLCCLKVEIKTGVFRMLPVHERDDAQALSYEFCKTNHLLNSVEALTNHVTLSMAAFTKA